MRQQAAVFALIAWVLGLAWGWPAELPLITGPRYGELIAPVTVPAFLEDRVVYYNSFADDSGRAQINTAGLVEPATLPTAPGGILGSCYPCGPKGAIVLKGPALSPHRAISLSLWWCMAESVPITGGLQVFHFQGKGIISNFVRGKGTWCALPKPAAVFQVYYFPGISDVNGIYDRSIWDRGLLEPNVWHNTVLTIAAASSLRLYTDGRLVTKVDIRGRPFAPEDNLTSLTLGNLHGGPRMLIDEVMLLDRAMTPREVGAYHEIVRQMRTAGYLNGTG